MPSKTEAQARLMAAVAHGWKPAGMKGPSRAVAQDFNEADKGSKLLRQAMMAKAIRKHGPGEDMRQHHANAPKHQPKTVD